MYEFIVLGMIPGTNIQISFGLWLQIVASLLICILLCTFALWTHRFFHLTNQLLTAEGSTSRVTQSHQRAQ